MFKGMLSLVSGVMLFFAATPAGTSYKLQSYGMGSGGVSNATSSSYAIEGISGETSGILMSGTSYKIGGGFIPTEQADVPTISLTNPAFYYNKLKLVINPQTNPSDATYAVAISSDNFATTQYVQDDLTVGASLGLEDYQTSTMWGAAGGVLILGLSPSTTYKAKAKAMQGKFTESGYGPIASDATINPLLTFDLDISATDSETGSPYDLAFGDLSPNTVVDSPQKIWVDFATNGESGGNIYMYGVNTGLRSTKTSYTIPSATANLSVASQGFGAQSDSVAQSSGGPLVAVSPYIGTSNVVGVIDTSIRKVYSSSAPVLNGRTSLLLKAKTTTLTPASNDYAETVTVIGAANF